MIVLQSSCLASTLRADIRKYPSVHRNIHAAVGSCLLRVPVLGSARRCGDAVQVCRRPRCDRCRLVDAATNLRSKHQPRFKATARPGKFERIRPICCAGVSWMRFYEDQIAPWLVLRIIGTTAAATGTIRPVDATPNKNCCGPPAWFSPPADRFIDHPAKHPFREPARINLRLADRTPCYREFTDTIIERKIRRWAAVPAFTEILFRMNRIWYLQSSALRMRRIQPPTIPFRTSSRAMEMDCSRCTSPPPGS